MRGEIRFRFVGKVDMDETAPASDVHVVQAELGKLEAGGLDPPGRREQCAVCRIRPGVVRADDTPVAESTRRFAAKDRAAVAAGVVEGAKAAIGTPRDDNALTADGGDEVVAGLRDRLFAAYAYPVPVPDGFEFALVMRRVVVPRGRQGVFSLVQRSHGGIRKFSDLQILFQNRNPVFSRCSTGHGTAYARDGAMLQSATASSTSRPRWSVPAISIVCTCLAESFHRKQWSIRINPLIPMPGM